MRAKHERLTWSTAGASPAELATLAMHIMDGLAAGTGVADVRHIVTAVQALDAEDYSQVAAVYSQQSYSHVPWSVACGF